MTDRTPAELADLLTLSRASGIGDARFAALLGHFGSARAVLEASPSELSEVEGISRNVADSIGFLRSDDDVHRQCHRVFELGVTVIARSDSEYPAHLAVIEDAPALLFVSGDVGLLSLPGIAIVGTRRPTPYGKQVTAGIARRLAERSETVVSGFARGVDGIAHRTVLNHGGPTVAVLGCGVDVVYPPEATELHGEIRAHGAIVSEFWMGTPPDAPHFPRRNRIISGLSRAVIVTEAPIRSGALITARIANLQNRDVFAVPGDVTRDQSLGANRLIADGAQIITGADDLLTSLGLAAQISGPDGDQLALPVAPPPSLPDEDRVIVESLSLDPMHVDDVAVQLGREASDLLTTLTLLEMQGLVVTHPGSRFSRAVIAS